MRADLEPAPPQIAALPLDSRGYPVPFFVDWVDGQPEFRAMSRHKLVRCVKEHLCWVCGLQMGNEVVFVVGPMCGINLTSSEPPSHEACARWSVRNCPFLKNPAQVRRPEGIGIGPAGKPGVEHLQDAPGVMIQRNPGVSLLWTTRSYTVHREGLFTLGKPVRVEWWAEGKLATRAQVEESIRTGLPKLVELCRDSKDLAELNRRRVSLEKIMPAIAV